MELEDMFTVAADAEVGLGGENRKKTEEREGKAKWKLFQVEEEKSEESRSSQERHSTS